MVERWAGPEDTHLFIHSLVGDAVVVRHTASRGDSQLLENVGRILKWKELSATEPMCQVDDDVGVASGVARGIDAVLPVNDAAFGTATEPVFFLMEAAGQNDIGMVSGFREKE